MADPFLVLLFVVAEKGHDSGASVLIASARMALGRGVTILVHESAEMPSDNEVLAIATSAHANAAVEMRWEDSAHRYASIHMHQDGVPSWNDRTLEFTPEDPPDERGRAVALTLSAMIWHGAKPPLEPQSGSVGNTSPAAASSSPSSSPKRALPMPEAEMFRGSVAVLGQACVGVDAPSATYGAALEGRLAIVPKRVAVRLVGEARTGTLPSAAATSHQVALGVGASWTFFVAPENRGMELSLRGDVLVLHQDVTRSTASGSQARQRWQSGLDGAVEGAWYFTKGFGLVVATGVEWAWGPTYVRVGEVQVASIPALRWLTEAGTRLRF